MVNLNKNAPRWMIFAFDVLTCIFSILLAYSVRFNFSVPKIEYLELANAFPLFLGIRILSMWLGKTYAGIIRYTSTQDAQRIFTYITIGSLLFCLLNLVRFYFVDGKFLLPFSVVIIDYLATLFLMIASRIAVKVLYLELKNPTKEKSNVILYGAGEAGLITKRTLDRDAGSRYRVLYFLDDDPNKTNKTIEGIKILAANQLDKILKKQKVENLILAIQNPKQENKQRIIETCLQHHVNVLNVPPVKSWINGELSFNQIKKVKIEDLLGRTVIQLDKQAIDNNLVGKTVLVTGAAGSIGSEIARQVLNHKPKRLILLDQGESPLYELDLSISMSQEKVPCEIVLADIRLKERIKEVFEKHKPEVVFHAAAYKHVPLIELNPSEAVTTNVLGTKNVADLAHEFKVDQFVLISTDKAVNPSSVMGATKRVAEIYVNSINNLSDTKFTVTRFGNVLGSNGSVIPIFRRQIEEGGPVTVTDPEVTRYFMTISEACQLVLEAAAMSKGGEVYLFNMGESVKIIDLAEKMIRLSGLQVGKDINIEISGLRPGEKLYEELLNKDEGTMQTHHPQIMISKVKQYEHAEISAAISKLTDLLHKQNRLDLIKQLKQIVPEYKSKNSSFEVLDQ